MDDFKAIMNYVFDLLSIEIPIFGYKLSIISLALGLSILAIAFNFILKIFRGV